MRYVVIVATLLAGSALSGAARADGSGFVAGAGAGAVTGAIVGGPVGAAVGAGVGGIVGGVASDSSKPNTVVIEQPPRRVIEEDTTGTVGCETTTVRERNSAGESVSTKSITCP